MKTTLKRFYLIDYRLKLGLTQRIVAEKMNIESYVYSGIENGYRGDLMNADKLLHLADALGVDVRQLCLDEIAYQKLKKEKNNN